MRIKTDFRLVVRLVCIAALTCTVGYCARQALLTKPSITRATVVVPDAYVGLIEFIPSTNGTPFVDGARFTANADGSVLVESCRFISARFRVDVITNSGQPIPYLDPSMADRRHGKFCRMPSAYSGTACYWLEVVDMDHQRAD